ncbi:pyruvate dehydrogenase (acetyl-transferring), homodimeric type [Ornithinimicrobium pratense]|uniref:Pyruvate dehydrogenase E1 component n=1 Tax=Ornithinimicrobium pratense TaxID=2593973 RepID=A0A5J6V6A8_9MICO|nr:pyruvate dehydrogenase (acetyl-transferring), homodimeric type [Ornithinimicrobium pratense]QFG68844.1 pyruvate dehydrogenase (acetyl-transferring), homodimeric type [Ornithinimicrobium pratense]
MALERPIGPILNGLPNQVPDTDPEETQEWLESLDAAIETGGRQRARYLMLRMLERARDSQVGIPSVTTTDYINTISPEQEPWFPGDEDMERRYRAWMRWNAAVMVHRAQHPDISVGGHISTYASQATLWEVGFNHFWRGRDHEGGGDQIFFQGHASPGIYARAFLEGRLSEADMDAFRQEKSKAAEGVTTLPSYPHPRSMQEFWQFPTVSMGLGPMNAIYQAAFNKYLHNRGLKDTSQQQVWAFLGDGEMDEPESRGLLHVAANDELDNLTFVVNCNLQRLDGPVRGNGKIVQELESQFRGAGWNVIKVLWGRGWDNLLAKDASGALINLMNTTPDGDFQTYRANDGAWIRDHFFGRDPRTKELVKDWSDDEIWWKLKRGGHDYRKVFAAYQAAMQHTGQPTVILAHTIKGYSLGTQFAGRNATHQMKKMTLEDLKGFRDSLQIPISDEQLEADPYAPPYYHPGEDDEAIQYLKERRRQLGGFLPERRPGNTRLPLPDEKIYDVAKKGSGKQNVATTMALVRIFKEWIRDKEFGKHLVPIIPDEARTFGMDSFFPTAKIYNVHGQNYTSVDADLMLAYKESTSGQIWHVGINEAGSVAGLTAAGTSYDTHGVPMVPFYIFYSMFGFQRTGDSIWAAADQLTRGFMIGATAGRTTLAGEGLQHADGHSLLLASSNPAIRAYDPAYAYELAHILPDALRVMYGEDPQDVIYYLTVYNEPMKQPAQPDDVDVEGILAGMHKISGKQPAEDAKHVRLLASGVGVPWALEAQELLEQDWGVTSDVWSVTSWNELRREAMACDRDAFLNPTQERRLPYVTRRLSEGTGPVVATSDWMRAVQDQIAPWVPEDYYALGADGFGFADTRPAARRFFHIDGPSMAVKALQMLADRGDIDPQVPVEAAERYRLMDVNAGASGTAGGDA